MSVKSPLKSSSERRWPVGAGVIPWLPRSGLPSPPALKRDPTVAAFVGFIRSSELSEAAYWFASAYAQLAGEERRKQLAMYFTPPSLTKRLLDDLGTAGIDFASRSFCDPACGGAAFLAPIAMRMRDSLRAKGATPEQVLKHVQSCLFGIDKDPTLCKLSRHFLLMALHDEVVAAGVAPKFQVVRGDSLLKVPHLVGTLDVVVCNPPFRKMSATEMAVYADEFADTIEAQPNLYAVFVALCVKLLARWYMCAGDAHEFLVGAVFLEAPHFPVDASQGAQYRHGERPAGCIHRCSAGNRADSCAT